MGGGIGTAHWKAILIAAPDDTDTVIDTSRSLEVDFDILDLKPENLTFRYRYRQETLSGEMRA